jgi:serine/threonine protein kinase
MLADFGVSRIAMANAGTTTVADSSGMTNWMAPELLTVDELPPATQESDIRTFGCICYEVMPILLVR